MKKLFNDTFFALFILFLIFGYSHYALAQSPTKLCYGNVANSNNCISVSSQTPFPVTSECSSSAIVNVAAGTTGELVALTTGQTIRVCSFVLSADTIATTAKFIYGTGTACATSPSDLTAAMRLQDEGNISISGIGPLFKTAVSNALCLTTTTGAATGFISYSKY